MDYFRILDLTREPFSNSPEPEFFFPSHKHLACLQQLELAIRLRRGLNVVMGDVGTGKSTLCRHLLLRFTDAQEDKDEIETHLLLDPSFTGAHEFLVAVADIFGLVPEEGQSDWQIKERIKGHLFRRGVDEKKIVLLIIDEGQKLPGFCLEILREFLNFETNENKLLQIVIFAQNEFRQKLRSRENLADRVNRQYLLPPLNFSETRAMIQFRLSRAGRPDGAVPLFTLPALWAIYRVTGGYPRKIITLCHQVLLGLIIQNRVRANYFLVRSTIGRLMPAVTRKGQWRAAGFLALLILAVLAAMHLFPNPLDGDRRAGKAPSAMAPPAVDPVSQGTPSVGSPSGPAVWPAAVPAESAAPHGKGESAPVQGQLKAMEASAVPQAIPVLLGSLKIREGSTALEMLLEVYGNAKQQRFSALIKANPHIQDMNRIRAGETILLPAIPSETNPLPRDQKWVQLAKLGSVEEAYQRYKAYPSGGPSVRLIPCWNRQEGLIWLIVLQKGFFSDATVADAIRALPRELAEHAGVMKPLPEDTIYFKN